MQFELKKTTIMGNVQAKTETTSSIQILIKVGIVDCPHEDICATNIAEYEFSNSLTIDEARAGIEGFAIGWVQANYPNDYPNPNN